MSDDPQSFIRTPRQLIVVVLLAFLVPTIVITLFAKLVSTTTRTGAGADSMTPEAIDERLRPIGRLELQGAVSPVAAGASAPSAAAPAVSTATGAAPASATAVAAAAPAAAAPSAAAPSAAAPATATAAAAPQPAGASAAGEKVYKTTCAVCHATGVAGAPKQGDKAAWEPRIKQGIDTLVKHSIDGIRAMPPRGGNANLSDEEMRAALDYMLAAVR